MLSVTGVRFYEWLCVCVVCGGCVCVCVCVCKTHTVNGCSLALMTVICIMDSEAILRVKDGGKQMCCMLSVVGFLSCCVSGDLYQIFSITYSRKRGSLLRLGQKYKDRRYAVCTQAAVLHRCS